VCVHAAFNVEGILLYALCRLTSIALTYYECVIFFEKVEEFKYLGTTLTHQNPIPEEIKSR